MYFTYEEIDRLINEDIPSSLYTSKGLNVGFGFDRGGLKASANISGEFIFIFNKGK